MPYRFSLPHYDPIVLRGAHSAAQAVGMGVHALFGSHEFLRFHDFYNRDKTRHYQSGESKVLIRAILNDGAENFAEQLFEIPNLIGATPQEAKDQLALAGLTLGKEYQEGLFADVVSKQRPKAGELVTEQSSVDIWLDIKKASVIEDLRRLASELRGSKTASSLLGARVRLLG